MFKADLHTHTTCSDGSFSPEELIAHAKEIGLSALSITDHDTIDAYKRAIPAAKAAGIILGSGVEFSALFKSMSVHVLGYDIDLHSIPLHAFCARHQERRYLRNRAILAKLAAHGMVIEEEELKGCGRPHIAQLMVEKGFVPTIAAAFQKYIGDHRSCFVRGESFSVEETLDIIHQAGGKAFLAHPHLIEHRNKIKPLLELSFDGIECYYARFPRTDADKWVKMAAERGLLVSGGSDFHGTVKHFLPLGASFVDEEHFQAIFNHPM